MSWNTPTARTTGELITASIWNQDVKDNPIALRAGGIAMASQAANDVVIATSSSQLGRVAVGSALQYFRVNSGGTGLEFATFPVGLRARAYRASSTQALTTGVTTKVQLNGETTDPYSEFDATTNYRWTASAAMTVRATGQVYINTPSGRLIISLYKNGAAVQQTLTYTVGNDCAVPVVWEGSVAQNDYLELYARHDTGTDKTIQYGSDLTSLVVSRLQ
ncbi:MAG: hypothetical protein AB7Q16_24785 [Vicinamibacterales bacterium]